MKQLRDAVEAKDADAIAALLDDDVLFNSPVAFTPYRGKKVAAPLLGAAITGVFEDFHYVRVIDDVGGRDHVLVFTARVGDIAVHGCDIVHVDDDGLIDDFTVMVRPLSAARAVADRITTLTSGRPGTTSA
ncbi:hypothetical protein ASG56_15410 [Rhodococcus sp. Leaf7]|uniref:nuclear transport factor 2 family protein n=1 Tax=unclassified Rhodococcus (in: high G+C Gram-positive bacteria) TaxID=192944 RepID=UPI0006F8A8B8|nr:MULTISPECIES: nuclear transport factor 2 family protein [unclassified Rhodococcus (in: high G+C Gram-positive bacteria)]KQU03169.1 hypothetical protein ASG56_15410 [Rhodococcus sp. Leaf7]KQU38268.1 hypothetical protein ASG64_18140 [Rhodococcus sp. Leaf247]